MGSAPEIGADLSAAEFLTLRALAQRCGAGGGGWLDAGYDWRVPGGGDVPLPLAEETGAPMHMHLLETPYQKDYARRRTGGSALAHIDRFGLVGPQLTIGHGVWMTGDDLDLLAERGGCLCHNCSSNLRLKSGIADLNGFLASCVPVALGIDEAGINDDRDMLQEMRLALTLHRPPPDTTPRARLLRRSCAWRRSMAPRRPRSGAPSAGLRRVCVPTSCCWTGSA